MVAGDAPAAVLLEQGEGHLGVVVGRADAVNTGHGGDNDGVRASQERDGGGVAEAVNFVVDGGVFLNVGVGGGDVGFGLIVVKVGDEVMDFVLGEELAELGIELGGEGFVVGEDEGGALDVLDEVGHGEGFAGAGHAEQSLLADAGVQAGGELGDGGWLVAGGLVFGDELEFRHSFIIAQKLARARTCKHNPWRHHPALPYFSCRAYQSTPFARTRSRPLGQA